MWTNNKGEKFNCKADAFKWLNDQHSGDEIEMPKIYFDGHLYYTLTPFGIFDEYFQTYKKGKLPVEYYN